MSKLREDRRVTQTRRVLKCSLLKLLMEKPIQRITVTDVCRRADVNRGTFYAHYLNPEDLLSQIQESLKLCLLQIFETDRLENILPALSETLRAEADFCRAQLSGHMDRSFLQEITGLIQDKVIAKWQRRYPHVSQTRLEMLFSFCFHGYIALLQEWLDGTKGQSGDRLEDVAKQLVAACVVHIATETAVHQGN